MASILLKELHLNCRKKRLKKQVNDPTSKLKSHVTYSFDPNQPESGPEALKSGGDPKIRRPILSRIPRVSNTVMVCPRR